MILIKMALRNIWRSPLRSLFTLLMVAISLAALIFLWSFSDGSHRHMIENVTSLYTGHFQIHAEGFHKRLKLEKTLADRPRVEALVRASPAFQALAPKVKSEALIGTSEQSSGIVLMGIDPALEPEVTNLQDYLREGVFLKPDEDQSVLIGRKLAERLEVGLGDKVVILVQERGGAMGGMAYRIKGIYKTDSEFLDEVTAYVTLKSAQDIFALGEDISEITVRLKSIDKLVEEVGRMRSALRSQPERYEVLTWAEVVPEIEGWIRWDRGMVTIILAVVTFVIGIGVMNTVLMSIFERTKEFGILKAIGIMPGEIVRLVLLETFFLECAGIILGTVLGLSLVAFYSESGIPMGAFAESMASVYLPNAIKTTIEVKHLVFSIVLMAALPVLISLYPALKAARLEPVKAIYHS